MKWFIKCFKHYVDFKGRAQRKEFWMFVLFAIVFGVILALALEFFENIIFNNFYMEIDDIDKWLFINRSFFYVKEIIRILYLVNLILPSMAVAVRRLHDIGKSGWNFFIGLIPLVGAIILIVWYCKDSEAGENQWGATPKTL